MRTDRQIAAELASLFPPGWAWETVRRQTGNMWAMLQPIADALAQIEQAAEALLPQIDPGQATDLLPDYERILGTDCCIGSTTDLPMAQRQTIARARWTQPYVRSLNDYISYAATLGFEISITEFAAARAGILRAGGRLYSEAWDYAWLVTAPGYTPVRFQSGISTAGEPLMTWGNALLRCQIGRCAPAHTTVLYAQSSVNTLSDFGGDIQ